MKEVSRRGRRKRWSQVKRWKDESGQRRMSLLLMTRSREVTLGKLSDGVRECRAGKNPSVSAMFSVDQEAVQRRKWEVRQGVKI